MGIFVDPNIPNKPVPSAEEIARQARRRSRIKKLLLAAGTLIFGLIAGISTLALAVTPEADRNLQLVLGLVMLSSIGGAGFCIGYLLPGGGPD